MHKSTVTFFLLQALNLIFSTVMEAVHSICPGIRGGLAIWHSGCFPGEPLTYGAGMEERAAQTDVL